MIFNVFIAVILIFCYVISYVKSATDYKNYQVRGIDNISIPNEIVNDNEVKEIMDKYFKYNRLRCCISTFVTIIMIPLSSELFMAIAFTILAVWLGFELSNNMRVQKKIDEYVNVNYIEFENKKSEVFHVDLGILEDSNEKILKNIWLLIPVVISVSVGVICSIIGGFEMSTFLTLILINVVSSLLLLYFNNYISKQKNIVYSTNSKTNLNINREEKGTKSKLYFSLVILDSALFIFIWMNYVLDFSAMYMFILITLVSVLQVIYVFISNNRIQTKIDEIPVDEKIPNERFYKTKYILGGMFYYDKESKKAFITEKNSPNFIPNLATVGGKITGAIIGASMIFVVLLPIGLFTSALTDVDVDLNEDEITFKYLVYTESVELNNVKSYKLLDKKPNLKMRTNGLAVDDKQIGYFKVEGYSKSKVYFEGDGLPVFYVKTDDKNFFVNFSEKVDVEKLYNELKKLEELGD